MRHTHGHYIADVNKQFPSWYVQEDRNTWVTSVPLLFDTIIGQYPVPEDTETDFFSVVPDTGYTRFHKASVLHDAMRGDKKIPREVADVCFFFEMAAAVKDIRDALEKTTCPQKVIDAEVMRLSRLSAMYLLGVSGVLGTLYIKLDSWF